MIIINEGIHATGQSTYGSRQAIELKLLMMA
jgi:hypothetical protein